MISWIQNNLGGVFTSIAAAIVIAFANWLRHKLFKLRIQKLLGFTFSPHKEVFLVYGRVPHENHNNQTDRPVIQRGQEVWYVDECEIRATNYISAFLAAVRRIDVRLNSDVRATEKSELTCISFGGPTSNYKTEDILNSPENIFARWEKTSSAAQGEQPIYLDKDDFRLTSGETFHRDEEFDYGVILRITSTEHPNTVWWICAGIGAWGTSGATWYLAKRWEKLIQQLGTWKSQTGMFSIPDFAVIVKVTKGLDDSARIVKVYKSQENGVVEVDISQA